MHKLGECPLWRAWLWPWRSPTMASIHLSTPVSAGSSANLKKIDALEGFQVISVACGLGHLACIVDCPKAPEKFKELEVFEGAESIPVDDKRADEYIETAPEKKQKAAERGCGKLSKKKALSESDEEESADDSDKPKGKGGRRQGGGRGRGSVASHATITMKNGLVSKIDGPPTKSGRGSSTFAMDARKNAPATRGRVQVRGWGRK